MTAWPDSLPGWGRMLHSVALPMLCALILLAIGVALTVWTMSKRTPRWLAFIDDAWLYLPWVLLFVPLLGAGVLDGLQRQQWQNDLAARFERQSRRIQDAVENRLEEAERRLTGARDFMTTETPDSGMWESYVRSLHLEQGPASFEGLGYAEYVPEKDMRRYLSEARRRRPSYDRHPLSPAADGFLVDIFAPAKIFSRLPGFDLGADPSLRAAAEMARDRRRAVMSGFVRLQEDMQPLLLDLYPVYADSGNGVSNSRFKGWIVGALTAEHVLRGVVPSDLPLHVQVFDGTDLSRENLLYESDGSGQESILTRTQVVLRGGRPWTLRFMTTPAFWEGIEDRRAGTPLWARSAMASVVLFGVGWLLLAFHRRGVEKEREAMADAERRLQALASGPYGHVLVDALDPNWPLIWADSRFELITGYSGAELRGQNLRILQGDDRDQESLADLRRAMREGRDARVVLRNYRKDGSPFWNELSVSPVRNPQGRLVQYAGVIQDATEREQNQRRLATQLAVIRSLAESPDFEEAVRRILEAFCVHQGWDLGVFWGLDGDVLRYGTHWTAPSVDAQAFLSYCRQNPHPREMGLPGFVWSRAEPLWVANLQKETDFPEIPLLSPERLVSVCGFPVINREGTRGVFTFYSRQMWPLHRNLMLLMVGVSSQISQFMDKGARQVGPHDKAAIERVLAEFIGDGMLVMDQAGYCIFANPAAARMLDCAPGDLLGDALHDRIHSPADPASSCDGDSCPILGSLQSTAPRHGEIPLFLKRRDGSTIPVTWTLSPIIDHSRIRGIVFTFYDASERLSVEEAWRRQLAEKDEVIDRMREELESARGRAGTPEEKALRAEVVRMRQRLKDVLAKLDGEEPRT